MTLLVELRASERATWVSELPDGWWYVFVARNGRTTAKLRVNATRGLLFPTWRLVWRDARSGGDDLAAVSAAELAFHRSFAVAGPEVPW